MFTSIADYFKDEEDASPSFIQLTRNILIFVIVTNLALVPLVTGLIGEGSQNFIALTVLVFTLTLEIIALLFVLRGRVIMAKVVVPLALIIAATIIAFGVNGLKNTGMVALPVILVVSAILLGKRVFVLITPLMVISVILVAIADLNGRIPFVPAGLDDAFIIIFLLVSGAGIINLLVRRLNESIQLARASEEIQKRENRELTELRSALEERVRQRTAELELANSVNEKRARQFEAITQVLKTISTIQGMEALLSRITEVISEQFSVYHSGIFMQDSNREFAVLRAANSEGGRKMLARNHKLRIGQTGIVGFVAATGQPRIALDVGADAAYFDNPDLPGTRSEIALPLRYAGKIIGVLDVQSTEPNAFNQDDIDVLVTLADQVAIAINNALTIEEAQKSLAEARSAISQTTQEAWRVMRPKSLGVGFQLTETAVKPLEKPIEGEHIQHAFKTGESIQFKDENQQSRLAIPVQLRGRTIGVIHLGARNHAPLTDDDADIAKAVAERLSLAIETATLLQATQQRADIERITTDISSRISSSTRFETILQTAAQELSRALGGSDVLVQIEPVSMKMVMDT
ncbi:MAG TPA: GAF domain-containing protein [Anaerolineales bacterium]|nr:GAF domain-containing protein [Anaerolineales bacterium]